MSDYDHYTGVGMNASRNHNSAPATVIGGSGCMGRRGLLEVIQLDAQSFAAPEVISEGIE